MSIIMTLQARESKFRRKNANTLAAIESLNHPTATKIASALVRTHSPLSPNDLTTFKKIEQQRLQLEANNNPLVDGTLGDSGIAEKSILISGACKASKPYKWALYLYFLIRELQPRTILELGTNLGISSSYLALAAKATTNSRVITLEGSPYRVRVAKSIHEKLGIDNVSYRTGLFTETLSKVLTENKPIDFAFIDGHHQYQPTIDYFNEIFLSSTDTATYLFDDIKWSEGMKKAWNEITNDPKVVFSIEVGVLGIVLCSKNRPQNKPHVFKIDTMQPRTLKKLVKSTIRKILGTK